MVDPGTIQVAGVDVRDDVRVAEDDPDFLLQVVGHTVGIREFVLPANDDVEVDVLLRACTPGPKVVEIHYHRTMRVDYPAHLFHRLVGQATVHEIVERRDHEGPRDENDIYAHEKGNPRIQPRPSRNAEDHERGQDPRVGVDVGGRRRIRKTSASKYRGYGIHWRV